MKTFGNKKSKTRFFQGSSFGEQENLFPVVQNSIQDLENFRINKKRNPDDDFTIKNARQRVSPPKNASSTSISTSIFHQSKFKSRVRGKKFYIECLSNARREDVAYLNQLLSQNSLGINFNVFITCPDWMENQLQFYELIEQLGFVRDTKPDIFFFQNLDPDALIFAIKNVLDQNSKPPAFHEMSIPDESEDESASPRSLVTLKSIDEFSRRSVNPSPLADNLLSYWDKFSLGSFSPHSHPPVKSHEETPLFNRSNLFEERDTGFKDRRLLHPISPTSESFRPQSIIPRPERKSITTQKHFAYFKHVEATPVLPVYQTENFITPQGKLCFMHKWLDSKPADPNCISFLREKLQVKMEESNLFKNAFAEAVPLFRESTSMITKGATMTFNSSDLCVISDLQAYQSKLSSAFLNDDKYETVNQNSVSDSLFEEEVRNGYGSSFFYHSPLREDTSYETKRRLKFSKARRLSKLMKTPERNVSLNYLDFSNMHMLMNLFEFQYSSIFFFIFGFLSVQDIKQSVQTINKKLYLSVLSYFITKNGVSNVLDLQGFLPWKKFSHFVKEYNHGCLIGEGACKRVYRLFSTSGSPNSALSIMDIKDLVDRGMEMAISKELMISILCSSLFTLKICPNLVRVYSSFKANVDPSITYWQRAETSERVVNRKNVSQGKFQYIHMEFCNEGDLESYVRKVGLPSVQIVRLLLFQMFFSVYSCRALYGLRHFDLKLLNFFLHLDHDQRKSMCIKIAENPFYLSSVGEIFYFLKLGDFGTAVFDSPLNSFVTVQQFCTLENSAPEYLILGSNAKQDFGADTFCLGLSMLHLLTGHEPYEELMKNVVCPKQLSSTLVNIWEKDPVVCEVIQSLIDPDDENSSFFTYGSILADTLYRYLVLFGDCPTFKEDFIENAAYEHSPIRTAIVGSLGLIPRTSVKNRSVCVQQYQKDKRLWSFHLGTNELITKARLRLHELGLDANFLFEKLLNWNVDKRCTMFEALTSPIFQEFRSLHSNCTDLDIFSYFAQRGIPNV